MCSEVPDHLNAMVYIDIHQYLRELVRDAADGCSCPCDICCSPVTFSCSCKGPA